MYNRFPEFVFSMKYIRKELIGLDSKGLKNPLFFRRFFKFLPFFFSLFLLTNVNGQDSLEVRFANPLFYCDNGEYCVDVEFRSPVMDHSVFGMNVRFFYPANDLTFIDFRNFQGGYGPVIPDPPVLTNYIAAVGMNLFGVNSPITHVNGAMQLLNPSQAIVIDTNWTMLFTVCFELDSIHQDQSEFCPPIIWDLEQNPENGSWLPGSDGVVITLVDPEDNSLSIPSYEVVDPFNWQYIGSGGQPFGEPISEHCIYPHALADISPISSPQCYYTSITAKPVSDSMYGMVYTWSFGADAVPPTAVGYGPHNIHYTANGSKTIQLIVSPEVEGTFCPDTVTTTVQINNCPGVASGFTLSDAGAPIVGVVINLCYDTNADGIPEGVYKMATTNSSGAYTMVDLIPGNYVLQQLQPAGWFSFSDFDQTEDFDVVPNISLTDNLIPATITPNEFDSQNRFIESASPGAISGSVFHDMDNDMSPDPGEGLGGVTIELYADANTNGLPDGAAIQTVVTSSGGAFIFGSVGLGSYLLKEIQPGGYTSVKDIDISNDMDIVANTNMTDDWIPVTLVVNEHDQDNFFIDGIACQLMVTNTNDSGTGSLRDAIECALPGETVTFANALANQTIMINSDVLYIDKAITIDASNVPTMLIASSIQGLFEVTFNGDVNLESVRLRAGLEGSPAGAIYNEGIVDLKNCEIICNPLDPTNLLIYNNGGEVTFVGSSTIKCD